MGFVEPLGEFVHVGEDKLHVSCSTQPGLSGDQDSSAVD
jgi:hypothetical protein